MSLVKHKINNKSENINIMGYNPKNNKIRNSMANLVNNKFIFLNKINMQQQLKNEKKRSSVNKLLYEIKLNYYTESNNNNISQNQNQINNVTTLKKSSNNCDINNSNTLLNSIDLSFLSKTLDKSKNKNQQKRLYSVSNSINESINYSPESRLHKNTEKYFNKGKLIFLIDEMEERKNIRRKSLKAKSIIEREKEKEKENWKQKIFLRFLKRNKTVKKAIEVKKNIEEDKEINPDLEKFKLPKSLFTKTIKKISENKARNKTKKSFNV